MRWSKITHLIYLNIQLSLGFSGTGALTSTGVERDFVVGQAHNYPFDSHYAGMSSLKTVNTYITSL